jgi:hypothetical protein
MRSHSPTRFVALTALLAGLGLAGCQTTSTTEQPKTSKEDMVYIPPSTGNMTGRWVPRSDANAPGISPGSMASGTSVKKLQTEGTKNSPSSPSVNQH